MSCTQEKRKLIEEVGLHFEKTHQLAPLAARIYAVMILSPNEGHSFEEIIEITCASKSAVSTNLNLLLQLKIAEYFTKPGDRKRYFRGCKTYLKTTLEDYLKKVSEELEIVEKIWLFNQKNNKKKYKKHKNIGMLFKKYLESHRENLEETIGSMEKINSEN